MAPRSLVLAGLAIAALLPMGAARAAEASHPTAATNHQANGAGAMRELSQPLSAFTGKATPIKLKDASSAQNITVKIPRDARPVHAILDLKGMNSAALAANASQLVLGVNGSIFAQVPLKGSSTTLDQRIEIPTKLLHPGANTLTFRATQTTGRSCEPFDAPQLWTQISSDSTIDVAYHVTPTKLSFSAVRSLLGEDGNARVTKTLILYDKSLARLPEPIMAAARALARLHGDQPIEVLARPLDKLQLAIAQTFPGDVILLREGRSTDKATSGAHGDARKRVMLTLTRNAAGSTEVGVTGPTSATVAAAARLLGERHLVWPNATRVAVTVPASANKQTSADPSGRDLSSFTLKQAGFPAQTVHGRKAAFPALTFWDPQWNSHALLHLHMAYSAGGGPGSMMQAIVNGKMVGTIPLSSANGGSYPDYKLLIPKNVLHAGENRLVLRTIFHVPSTSQGSCPDQGYGASLAVTLFSDTHLVISGGSRVATDHLAAVVHGLYPVHAIAISAPSGSLLSAAATLGARLAQTDGQRRLTLLTGPIKTPQPGTIILGPESQLPAAILKPIGLSASDGPATLTESTGDNGPEGQGVEPAISAWLRKHLSAAGARHPANRRAADSNVDPVAVTGFAKATIVAFASHDSTGAAADQAPPVVVTAATDQQLQKSVFALVHPSRWQQIRGRAVIADPGSTQLQVLPAASTPLETSAQLGYLAGRYPVIAIMVIIAGFAFFIVVIRALVSLRRRRRHPSVKGVDDR